MLRIHYGEFHMVGILDHHPGPVGQVLSCCEVTGYPILEILGFPDIQNIPLLADVAVYTGIPMPI